MRNFFSTVNSRIEELLGLERIEIYNACVGAAYTILTFVSFLIFRFDRGFAYAAFIGSSYAIVSLRLYYLLGRILLWQNRSVLIGFLLFFMKGALLFSFIFYLCSITNIAMFMGLMGALTFIPAALADAQRKGLEDS